MVERTVANVGPRKEAPLCAVVEFRKVLRRVLLQMREVATQCSMHLALQQLQPYASAAVPPHQANNTQPNLVLVVRMSRLSPAQQLSGLSSPHLFVILIADLLRDNSFAVHGRTRCAVWNLWGQRKVN